jgi:dienelactone hydrolase
MTTDTLNDFTRDSFTARGRTRPVYRLGTGPVVIVLSEMPGITPLVADFARAVAARGLQVVMPHLFGEDGGPPTNAAFRRALREVCVSREFTLFATKKPSRITEWLNDLARAEHDAHGGPGVGVVGMCLTGGFALAMMVDPVVVAPVLSQPSLPIAVRRRDRGAVQLSNDQMQQVRERVDAGVCVLGLRFTGDKLVPEERFATLRRELGDGFLGVEIDSSVDNPWGYKEKAHSVLTEDLGPEGSSPTRLALEQVLAFFGERLGVTRP